MSTRLQFRLIFLTAFVGGLVLFMVLGMQEVAGFGSFKIWTSNQNIKLGSGYVKQSSVDNAIIGTVLAQISFGNDNYKVPATTDSVFGLFENSQALVNVDVIQLLTSTDKPEEALLAHLKHTGKTIAEIESTGESLQQLAQEHLTISKQCLQEKQRGDKLFFDGAQQGSDSMSDEGLAIALEAAPCYITNRIQANAYSFLAQKVTTNAAVLKRREQLLTVNKDLLLTHTAYLEGNVLEQLLQLKNQLAQVNTVSYDKFQGLYNFGNITLDYGLPRFNYMFFDPEKSPTYLNPEFDLEPVQYFTG